MQVIFIVVRGVDHNGLYREKYSQPFIATSVALNHYEEFIQQVCTPNDAGTYLDREEMQVEFVKMKVVEG